MKKLANRGHVTVAMAVGAAGILMVILILVIIALSASSSSDYYSTNCTINEEATKNLSDAVEGACANGHWDGAWVREVLEQCPDVNVLVSRSWTALMVASALGDRGVVEALLNDSRVVFHFNSLDTFWTFFDTQD